jgi:hypothetical protein
MKRLLALFLLVSVSGTVHADQHVRGHNRGYGTYVQPHYRSDRDGSYNNNWSTQGNINPYTGTLGKRAPTWNDRAPERSSGFGYSGYRRSR